MAARQRKGQVAQRRSPGRASSTVLEGHGKNRSCQKTGNSVQTPMDFTPVREDGKERGTVHQMVPQEVGIIPTPMPIHLVQILMPVALWQVPGPAPRRG